MASVAVNDSMDLKVNELLKAVRQDYSPAFTKLVNDTVSAIRRAIKRIPDDLEVDADVASSFIRDVGADKVRFRFRRPKSIEIGGSHVIQGIVKPDVNVDLFMRLPKECFLEKDYLNYRYHGKRCLYLCIIKKYLQSSSMFSKVEWLSFQNEARKPVLVVYPAVENVEVPGFSVKIIPTATSLFNISKLSLKRNNIHNLNEGIFLQATPKYNNSILEDMFLEDTTELVKKTFLGSRELVDALILLKVWARQRTLINVHDCLNGFLLSILLSYIRSQNIINDSMKALQIFRVMLKFIATSDSWNRGLYFKLDGQTTISKEEKMQHRELFPVVICNQSSNLNLAFRMTQLGFTELQDEAALALACMERCQKGGFEEIFMTKIDYATKYDHCIRYESVDKELNERWRLNLKGNVESYALRFSSEQNNNTLRFCLDDECWRLFEQKVYSLLNQGLTDRAKLIRVSWCNTKSEFNVEDGLSKLDREPIFIGILISSSDKAFRMVDIGPNPENKEESNKFRKFWGDKADVRLFKDGRIAESIVWASDQWTRHLILKKIVEHVLLGHLSIPKENIKHIVDQLDFCLLYGSEDKISSSGSLLMAFEALSKCLRLIEDIPLKVSTVQPLDSAFRFTSVFPPSPHILAKEKNNVLLQLHKSTPCIESLEIMIQLEGSGNWPDNDISIEKTKSAFLLKIGDTLQSGWGYTCIATEDSVDVLVSGFAFRLRIWHERGLALLNRELGNGLVKRVSSTDRKLFFRSQHSSMINGFQAQYPIYGSVVRLAKRWVTSHLFSACLVEEAIELLVASLFVQPLPLHTPCSRITGFFRFLRLLSEYDWAYSPLVVDINNDLSNDALKEISANFMRSRKGYEEDALGVSPTMFLATTYDKESEAWTSYSPKLSELKRLVAYASSSAGLLTKLILQDDIDSYGWECLFRTPLTNYDAVILLHRDKLPYPKRLLFASEMNKGRHVVEGKASKLFHPFMSPVDLKGNSSERKNNLLINFDPMKCFVEDLQKEFSNTFSLWYDSLGGDAIGLTWKEMGSKKRGREESAEEEKDPVDVLKAVGEAGKGFTRSIYLLKAPKAIVD